MDEQAFKMGYLMGVALAHIRRDKVQSATAEVEVALPTIIAVDREFRGLLAEGPSQPLFRPRAYLGRQAEERRQDILLADLQHRLYGLAERGRETYQKAMDSARELYVAMEEARLHDAITAVASAPPEDYERGAEVVQEEVERLASSLGVDRQNGLGLIGDWQAPGEALNFVASKGSRGIFISLLAMKNPFSHVVDVLSGGSVIRRSLESLWPRREEVGPVLAGLLLIGTDILSGVHSVLAEPSLVTAAAGIQAMYSIPDGLARIGRGVERLRERWQ